MKALLIGFGRLTTLLIRSFVRVIRHVYSSHIASLPSQGRSGSWYWRVRIIFRFPGLRLITSLSPVVQVDILPRPGRTASW